MSAIVLVKPTKITVSRSRAVVAKHSTYLRKEGGLMKLCVLGLSFVLVMLVASAPEVLSQQAESSLVYCTDIHVRPARRVDFETQREDFLARMAAAKVTFSANSAVSDRGVYRTCTLGLANMAAMDTRRAEMQRIARGSEANTAMFRESSVGFESSMWRSMPELGYAPAGSPGLGSGGGFVRESAFYLKAGAGRAVVAIMQRFRMLLEEHDVQLRFLVNRRVIGTGPTMSVYVMAPDAGEFYARWSDMTEQLGEDFQTLQSELFALTERTEQTIWTPRPDLGYQPAN